MKIGLALLSFILFNSLCAQKPTFHYSKSKENDSLYLNYIAQEDYFAEDTNANKYHISEGDLSHIRVINLYNHIVGKSKPNLAIHPKIYFKDSLSLDSISYIFLGKSIHFSSNRVNGFFLSVDFFGEGSREYINLSEYKNTEENGIDIHCYSRNYSPKDSFVLEVKYFKNDFPTGEFYSYFRNGQIKEHGDSVYVFNKHLEQEHERDIRGNIVRTYFVKGYDTVKKGFWRTYNEHGELLNELFYK